MNHLEDPRREDFSGFPRARSALLLVVGALVLEGAACGGDDPETGTGGGGGSTTSVSSGGGGDSTTSASSGSASSGSGASSGTGGAGGAGGAGGMGGGGGGSSAECGDGVVEGAEQCDDGNKADGDYCAADCSSVTGSCGDNAMQPNEACDDGNTAAGDYCAADCGSVTGACGDGVVQSNETCDDGMIKADCGTFHDGGDGKCVAPGTCSPSFVLVMGQCKPALITDHVHIMPDNVCNITTNPTEYFVPAGQKLKLSYHNHSANIPIDVWMHYNGGYTDLQPGGVWNEQYEHCFGPAPSEGYAEITACNKTITLPIHCL